MPTVNLERANANKRVCAVLADFLLITILDLILLVLFKATSTGIISSLLGFLLLVFRDSYQGQSPGKMFVGLKVVDLNGNTISFAASFKRNIILFWPSLLFPFFPQPDPANPDNSLTSPLIAVGAISLLIYITEYIIATRSKDGRRMGDLIGGTKVIDLHPEQSGWTYAITGAVILIVNFVLMYYMGRSLVH